MPCAEAALARNVMLMVAEAPGAIGPAKVAKARPLGGALKVTVTVADELIKVPVTTWVQLMPSVLTRNL